MSSSQSWLAAWSATSRSGQPLRCRRTLTYSRFKAGLAVSPAARRQGEATALLHAALAEACRQGARKLSLRVLASNPRAQALYAALGFEVEGVLWEEFRLENGSFTDDIVMARRLS